MGNIAKIAGGIVGSGVSGNTLAISGCYSVSSITINDDVKSVSKGGIVGSAGGQITVANSYYFNNVEDNGYGIPKSEPEMKTQEFVDLLNNGGNVYAMDLLNVNNGFPVFSRYASVVENHCQDNVSVYPNPAKDLIRIEFSDNSDCQSVEIYSIDGRLVETFPETSHQTTINIGNLTTGIYIMRVRLSDGMEYSQRIIKE